MIVVAGRAGSVDGLRLIRLVVEEVEVGSLLMQRGIGDGDADHGAGGFAILAVFIGEGGGIEVGAGDGERLGYFWMGNQSWAMQRPRYHASQPIHPGVLTVSVSSL